MVLAESTVYSMRIPPGKGALEFNGIGLISRLRETAD